MEGRYMAHIVFLQGLQGVQGVQGVQGGVQNLNFATAFMVWITLCIAAKA